MAKIISLISWCVLMCAVGYDIYLLNKYAFYLPFWDVWDNLPRGNFKGVFKFYNENLQLFYNILSELMYIWADWNQRYFAFVNFAIYLCVVGIYIVIIGKSQIKLPLYPLFFLPLLSPILGYNWLWSILVQTHTYILFFLLAVYFGFCKDKTAVTLSMFTGCLILSVLSMNLPLALGCIIAYIVKETLNITPQQKKETAKEMIILVLVFAVFLALIWMREDSQAVKDIKLDNVFSMHYISNLSFYIIEGLSLFALTGIITSQYCLPLFAVLLVFLGIAFFEQCKNKKLQALWGIIFCVMFNTCCVVALRHGEVYSHQVGFIRHHEVLFLLLPAMLSVLLSSRYMAVKICGVVICCGMLYGFFATVKAKQFQFFGELFYKNACVCLNHYYNLKTIAEWQCTMNFPIPVDERMQYAQEHNLSFFNNIAKCNE